MPGPYHKGWGTIVVAASGPSFTEEQAALVELARDAGACHVLAVGRTGPELLPNADALYYSDAGAWKQYANEFRRKCPRAELWTHDKPSAKEFGLHHIPRSNYIGLSKDLGKITVGSNSGYQAIGLAYLFGAQCLILVGFDMQRGPNGEAHHFGTHAGKLSDPSAESLKGWCLNFVALARDLEAKGVDVVNCTERTALTCFRRVPLGEIIECIQE